jgi:nucleotide-binding universal stress UspA family protein
MLNNITKILIPTDFSEASIQALIYSNLIGVKTNAELVLLHVREDLFDSNHDLILPIKGHEDLYKSIDERLDKVKEKFTDLEKIGFTILVSTGKVHKSIQNIANQIGANLVIMATSDNVKGFVNGVKRYVLGSNTCRTVEVCDIPIITIHVNNTKKELKCIVLPIDIEDDSTTDKVEYTKNLAIAYGASIHVLAIADDAGSLENVDELKRTLKNVCTDLQQHGLEVETNLLHSVDIAIDIVDYSIRNRADLIVIMSKKAKSFDQLFLQSEERIIIENERIPVLSLKPNNNIGE